MNSYKGVYIIQGVISGALAWISTKLGILSPILAILLVMMTVDYLTGMLASKTESLDHPGDKGYGWNSRKGAKGIIKKVGYLCVIAAGMVTDYVIISVAGEMGLQVPSTAFFGILVAVWYLLNEILSVIENAGRMGASVPEWLCKYIAALKDKIDSSADDEG